MVYQCFLIDDVTEVLTDISKDIPHVRDTTKITMQNLVNLTCTPCIHLPPESGFPPALLRY